MTTAFPHTIVVAGAGSAGLRHMRNVRTCCPGTRLVCWRMTGRPPDAELAALADYVVFDAETAQSFHPDAVIVAGAASTHAQTALPFVSRRVPVLVEKPITAGIEECNTLLAAVAEAGGVFVVGYTLRFHPLLLRLSAELRQGAVGTILGARAEVGQYLPGWRPGVDWRASVTARPELGGGALLEISHEFDYVRWLLGEVRSVACMTNSQTLGIEVDEYAEVLLRFESGAIGCVHLDLVQRPTVRRCRIIGEEGVFELDLLTQTLREGTTSGSWREVAFLHEFDRNTLFVDELMHFLACARGQDEPRITGEDGRRALSVALAARRSAAEGREIVL